MMSQLERKEERIIKTKPFNIPKAIVVEAYKRVKKNKGSAGIDKETLEVFDKKKKDNLYKIWNRMSSGSYYPPSVKTVEIPKKNGGIRKLGIPTVTDRIAQMVGKIVLEPKIEPHFHKDSYGYRAHKSAIQAVGKARKMCWKYNWVIDLDIKGFFDNIDHGLMLKAVKHHVEEQWLIMYIERWLKAKAETLNGKIDERKKGTPQGGVISPLLANLFLHYAFDKWMQRNHPEKVFERYADDCIIHCKTLKQAEYMKVKIMERLKECKLELHPEKTKIVYCKDKDRRGNYANTQFEFLGYTFRTRSSKDKHGRIIQNFLPAISKSSSKKIRDEIRRLEIKKWTSKDIQHISKEINSKIRGWINYYGSFYKSALYQTFYIINRILIKWVMIKYKKRWRKACKWLRRIAKGNSRLFSHWELGITPSG